MAKCLDVDGSFDFMFCSNSRWRFAGTTSRDRVTRASRVHGLYNLDVPG